MAKVVIIPSVASGVTTAWQLLNPQVAPMNTSVAVVVSGTVNYTCNYTYDDPTLTINPSSAVPPVSWPIAALTAQTATKDTVITQPIMAVDMTVNSGTGTATLYVLQAGIRQS